MTMRTLIETKSGPIRTVIRANTMSLLTFAPAERNVIMRTALQAGGDFWIRTFLGKRLSAYAYRLSYRVSAKWKRTKEQWGGVATPFVGLTPVGGGHPVPTWKQSNGQKLSEAIKGAYAKAKAQGLTKQVLEVRVPYGHAIPADKSAVFRTVPSWELNRFADVVGKTLASILTTGKLALRDKPGQLTGPTTRTIVGAVSRLPAHHASRTIGGGPPRAGG